MDFLYTSSKLQTFRMYERELQAHFCNCLVRKLWKLTVFKFLELSLFSQNLSRGVAKTPENNWDGEVYNNS